MRQLHVVGVSRDGRSLVLATDPDALRGGYRVAVDDRLHAAVRGDIGRPGTTGKPESRLSPREVQSRLRAGQSPEAVAQAAGVPLARVERYAGPVLAERQRVLDQALDAYFVKARRGTSAWPLGRAVAAHLDAVAGLDDESVTWGATRDPAGTWVVRLDYVVSGRRRKAQWAWDALASELRALDTNAGTLAHLDGPPPGPAQVRRRPRTATPTVTPAGPVTPVGPDAPAATSRPGQSRPGRDRAVTGPREQDEGPPPSTSGAGEDTGAGEPRRRRARRRPEASGDVLPLRGGRRRRRASVPSWDDVLLGGPGAGPARGPVGSEDGTRREENPTIAAPADGTSPPAAPPALPGAARPPLGDQAEAYALGDGPAGVRRRRPTTR